MRIAACAVVILANGFIAAGQTGTVPPPHRMPVVPQALLERPIERWQMLLSSSSV